MSLRVANQEPLRFHFPIAIAIPTKNVHYQTVENAIILYCAIMYCQVILRELKTYDSCIQNAETLGAAIPYPMCRSH